MHDNLHARSTLTYIWDTMTYVCDTHYKTYITHANTRVYDTRGYTSRRQAYASTRHAHILAGWHGQKILTAQYCTLQWRQTTQRTRRPPRSGRKASRLNELRLYRHTLDRRDVAIGRADTSQPASAVDVLTHGHTAASAPNPGRSRRPIIAC